VVEIRAPSRASIRALAKPIPCSLPQPVTRAWRDSSAKGFGGIGCDGDIVGVVEGIKHQPPETMAATVVTPLAESMLVAGSLSLVAFLPRIADRDYRLVLERERIIRVVTPSDVVQLPVRLLVFALLISLG
jgi:hypothetical protein